MDLLIVVFLLFYSIIIEAKDFLRTGRGDDIRISENSVEDESPKDVDAILLVLDRHASKKSKHIYPNFESEESDKKVWEEVTDSAETDMSGDTNSDEYRDTDSDAEGDDQTNNEGAGDGDGNIGHKMDLSEFLQGKTTILRKKWRSCLKKGAKVCTQACVASYKTACDTHSCKKKLKKTLKKECKRNCKDFFE